MVVNFETFFNSVTLGLRHVLNFLEGVFIGMPWPLMAVLIVVTAWRVGGSRVGVFSVVALAYLGLFGYWEKSMSTMSLVAASALLCILFGTPIGILCGKNARVYAMVKPVLDFMQTMPSFVYLIPAVAFLLDRETPGGDRNGNLCHAADGATVCIGYSAGTPRGQRSGACVWRQPLEVVGES